jgi:hypothetical protein
MGFVGTAHFIFCLHWHQPHSVALSLCVGCDRRFLLALAWVIFSLWLEKKLTSRKTELQLDTMSLSQIFSCSFARIGPSTMPARTDEEGVE